MDANLIIKVVPNSPNIQNIPHFFVRNEADGVTRLDTNVKLAAKLAPSAAITIAKKLRTKDPKAEITCLSADGKSLYEEETRPDVPAGPDLRVPVYDEDTLIRIIPGAAGAWYIRFFNSPQSQESIRGSSPEECLSKYFQNPFRESLEPYVERYVRPEEQPVDPRDLQMQFRSEQLNGRRPRPGDGR